LCEMIRVYVPIYSEKVFNFLLYLSCASSSKRR